jgi:opacity protein-like surface antigen
MMKLARNFLFVLVCFLAGAISSASYADYQNRACCTGKENPKWYAGISGNVVFLSDVDLGQTFINLATSKQFTDISFDPGFGVGGVVGYRFYPNIAAELELMYRQNDLDKIGVDPYSAPSGFYTAQKSYAIMGNLMYSYRQLEPVHPYFGFGAGMVNVRTPLVLTENTSGQVLKFKDWLFGYQFMAGFGYPIHNTPLELNFGYRFMKTEEGEKAFAVAPATKFTFDNTTHNFDLGFKINF